MKGFRIAARTLLELGAELISSDGIALYELLKNSVDAGASTVRISVNVSLKFSKFLSIRDQIDAEQALIAQGSVASSAIEQRETAAVSTLRRRIFAELEADAPNGSRILCQRLLQPSNTLRSLKRSLARFYDRANWIVVSDHGEGMTLADLSEIYLTIGTRSRQKSKGSPVSGARTYLGEKGVGRLSTMRLGGLLRVETSQADDRRNHTLHIDWDRFSHDSDEMLEDIKVAPREGTLKEDRAAQGTTVTIARLKADWDATKFNTIVSEEFSRLVDPFENRRAGRLLRLYYNGQQRRVSEIERKLFEIAHAECKASFSYEDGIPVLRGLINYRLRTREKSFVLREPELRGILRNEVWSAAMALGPFELEFWWYNRAILTSIAGLGKKAEVQKLVRRWSGGLMLFRNGFRINPYGGAEDDWLGLDKRAFGSRGFKLNRQQVIGRVKISSLNKRLVEQTNREGLTETPEMRVMVALLHHVLYQEFKAFLDTCDKDLRVQQLTTLEELEENVERAQNDISRRIRQVIARVPSEKSALGDVERLVHLLNSYIAQARDLAKEYESDRAKFVYLAGIGLMVEFILHELGRATNHTMATLKSLEADMTASKLPEILPAAFRNLSQQLSTIVKRVESLDPLSTSRRQRREKFDVIDVLKQIVLGRQAQAERHKIEFTGNYADEQAWMINGVQGMFIQIVENLIANSVYWIGVQRDIEPRMAAYIEIDVDPESKTVVVSDNGTGVDPKSAGEIFEAFVSHRPAREGKGLGLYISREIAGYDDWTLDLVREATVRKGRYNSFILDMSGSQS